MEVSCIVSAWPPQQWNFAEDKWQLFSSSDHSLLFFGGYLEIISLLHDLRRVTWCKNIFGVLNNYIYNGQNFPTFAQAPSAFHRAPPGARQAYSIRVIVSASIVAQGSGVAAREEAAQVERMRGQKDEATGSAHGAAGEELLQSHNKLAEEGAPAHIAEVQQFPSVIAKSGRSFCFCNERFEVLILREKKITNPPLSPVPGFRFITTIPTLALPQYANICKREICMQIFIS